jgi:hypothetical protein
MTNTQKHAIQEFSILEKYTPDSLVLEFKGPILALCEAFGESGQSGGSTPYVVAEILKTLNQLLQQQTISPITGEEWEWTEVTEGFYQNKRDGAVFKEGLDGKPYYIDAIVFDGNIGGRFNGHNCVNLPDGSLISSHQYIKSFPFTPKTFYVDVWDYRWDDKEGTKPNPEGDWWTHEIKDVEQLEQVFEYYDKQ